LLQGNEAVAEGALAAGCNFFAGYPITPSSEVLEIMAKRMPLINGSFIQMEDEIASIAAVIGASLAGAKAMTATSGPGFSLMQENIGFACMAEVPCVILNVMRGGFSTGLPTSPGQGDVMQSRWGTHGDHPIIVLAVSSVEECFYQTVRAFNLSEQFRTPVIILSDEMVGHTREKIASPALPATVINRPKPTVPPDWYVPYKSDPSGVPAMADFGSGYRYHVTGLVHDERGFPTQRVDEIEPFYQRLFAKINRHLKQIVDFEIIQGKGAEVVIVAYGSTARSSLLAVEMAGEEGLPIGLFKIKTLTPFPYQDISNLTKQVKGFLVPEMNLGQVVLDVALSVQGECRVETINRIDGKPINPVDILNKAKELLEHA
jgi:2-oxoglutarate ferredoxin oxidoreductase subunit alpha